MKNFPFSIKKVKTIFNTIVKVFCTGNNAPGAKHFKGGNMKKLEKGWLKDEDPMVLGLIWQNYIKAMNRRRPGSGLNLYSFVRHISN